MKKDRSKVLLGLGGQQIFDYVDTVLSAAQVNALNASPLQIIPSPGPGWAAIFEAMVAYYVYGSAAFTIGSASGLAVKYTNGSGLQLAQVAVTGFIDQATNQLRYVPTYRAASGAGGITPVPNSLICLNMLTAEVTVGTGCQLKIRAYYRRVPATL